jgi:hypothetical protein
MGTITNERADEIAETIWPLVARMDDMFAGVNMGDAVLALAFMIHRALETLPDNGPRQRAYQSVMDLIDPDDRNKVQ